MQAYKGIGSREKPHTMRSDKHTILIIDDMQEYLNSLERTLRSIFEVRTALNLPEAKEKATPDIALALVDIRLSQEDASNRDGLEFLRWARAKYPNLPIVMMSAYSEFEAAVDALNLGANKFLKKPINVVELKALLKQLIEEGKEKNA